MTKTYKQLTMDERTFIQLGLMMALKPAQIALELSRSTSTITRELQRNGWIRLFIPLIRDRGTTDFLYVNINYKNFRLRPAFGIQYSHLLQKMTFPITNTTTARAILPFTYMP